MMLHTFATTSNAVAFARTYRPQRTTILTDASGAVDALLFAVSLRERAEPFDLILAVGHAQADAAGIVATNVAREEHDVAAASARYDAFESKERNARGDIVSSYMTIPRHILETLRQCATLADRLVYRSTSEALRVNIALQLSSKPYIVCEASAAGVPSPEPRAPDGTIVVWAPDIPVPYLGIVRLALAELARPVVVVGADATEAQRRDALRRASLVVAPSHDDPGPAVALAPWGIPLCAPLTSGVAEFLVGCTTYIPRERAAIAEALRIGIGCGAPIRRASRPVAQRATNPVPPLVTRADVLVVVRSDDTTPPDRRARTHASIAAQRNARVTVRDVVGRGTRRTRLLNAAVEAETAPFVCVVDAGDVLFPDHVAALGAALERSDGAVAYAEVLLAHVDALTTRTLLGYSLVARRPPERAAFAVFDPLFVPALRSMIRRDDLIEIGGWNAFLGPAADHDLFLRLRERADFLYVDRVTSRSDRTYDAGDQLAVGVLATDYRLLYGLHPLPDESRDARRRRDVLAFFAVNRDFGITPPPIRFG